MQDESDATTKRAEERIQVRESWTVESKKESQCHHHKSAQTSQKAPKRPKSPKKKLFWALFFLALGRGRKKEENIFRDGCGFRILGFGIFFKPSFNR
jgi:hypothetical protein